VQEAGLAKDCLFNWGPAVLPLVDAMEFVYFYGWRIDFRPFVGDIGKSITLKIFDSYAYVQSGFNNTRTWRTSRPVLS